MGRVAGNYTLSAYLNLVPWQRTVPHKAKLAYLLQLLVLCIYRVMHYLEKTIPMATPDYKAMSNHDCPADHIPPSGSKKTKAEKCVTCKKEATVDIIECQWCANWEHKVCVNIRKYLILDSVLTNIMFYCSTCISIVLIAFTTYDVHLKVGSLNKRLHQWRSQNLKMLGHS